MQTKEIIKRMSGATGASIGGGLLINGIFNFVKFFLEEKNYNSYVNEHPDATVAEIILKWSQITQREFLSNLLFTFITVALALPYMLYVFKLISCGKKVQVDQDTFDQNQTDEVEEEEDEKPQISALGIVGHFGKAVGIGVIMGLTAEGTKGLISSILYRNYPNAFYHNHPEASKASILLEWSSYLRNDFKINMILTFVVFGFAAITYAVAQLPFWWHKGITNKENMPLNIQTEQALEIIEPSRLTHNSF